MTINATRETFAEQVLRSDKPGLVDFWAEWCPQCRQLGPVLEQLSKEQAERLTIVKVNVDEQPELEKEFDIVGIPALKLFKGGEVVHEIVGALPKRALLNELDAHLS